MSAYGYRRDTTPFLRALATESIVFDHAASQWPKTVPAFASIMTGKFGHSNGVMRFTTGQALDDSHEALAEMMAAAGYDTAAFVSTSALNEKTNVLQGFKTAVETFLDANPFGNATKTALGWLARRREKPFFAWVHYNNAHYPYNGGGGPPDMYVDDEYYDASRPVKCNMDVPMKIPAANLANLGSRPLDMEVVRRNIGGIQPAAVLEGRPYELDYYVARYDAGIHAADAQIGRLIRTARKQGLLGNTIIAVVGDHGEAFGEHNYYVEHGRFPYDDCVLVPMMIRPVGDLVPARVKVPVPAFAVAPTLLEMVGIRPPQAMEAKSLLGLMRGGPGPRFVYTESGYMPDYTISVREQNWKLIHIPNSLDRYFMNDTEYELYDLSNDPGELKNLVAQQSDVAARLRQTLTEWSKPWVADAYSGPMRIDLKLDTETIGRLRALGYVE